MNQVISSRFKDLEKFRNFQSLYPSSEILLSQFLIKTDEIFFLETKVYGHKTVYRDDEREISFGIFINSLLEGIFYRLEGTFFSKYEKGVQFWEIKRGEGNDFLRKGLSIFSS